MFLQVRFLECSFIMCTFAPQIKNLKIFIMQFNLYKAKTDISAEERSKVVDFLYTHLDEFGDEKEDISKCIAYALQESKSFGGFVLTGYENDEIVGVVVINQTGMKGYIPENILVYIAVNSKFRGKGYGKQLMNKALEEAEGNVALHVEPNNPAKFLYEKLGFTNKYLEMRLAKA